MKPSKELTSAIDQLLAAGTNLSDGVDPSSLAFKVGTHQNLANETHTEQQQASKPLHSASNQQRAVLGDDVLTPHFVGQHAEEYHSPENNPGQTPFAKKVHGSRQIAQKKADRQNVEEDPEGASQAIVRGPACTLDILDGYFDHLRPVEAGQGRDKPVKFTVKVDVL